MMTQKQFKAVKVMLIEGFGVEDIAIKLRARVSDVRLYVARLRAFGELGPMFAHAKMLDRARAKQILEGTK
jgi:hypothetical protein